jgi:hypothetical protein
VKAFPRSELKMEDAPVFLQQEVLVDKKTMLSETGKIKIKEALEALKKKEIKEFDKVDDLIKELNS